MDEIKIDVPPDGNADSNDSFTSLYEWLQSMVTAWVILILVFVFIGRHYGIEGPSMIPTLHEGNSVIISNLFFTPKYMDVIVLRKLEFSDEPVIKRVIATGGQLIDIDYEAGTVSVDGRRLDEFYINERMVEPWYESLKFPMVVPDGKIFVMGDNRNHSNDGRDVRIGFVDRSEVLGKAYAVIWPISDIRLL